MMESHGIMLFATGFGVVSWLLTISFFLGWNAANLRTVSKSVDETRQTVKEIFARLDELSRILPHQCIQIQRIAVVEAKQHDVLVWKERMEHEHQALMIRAGHIAPDERG